MNSRTKIKERLSSNLSDVRKLMLGVDFGRDRDGSETRIKAMITILNKSYPLAGFVNYRFQEELLVNLREFEHRHYIEVTAWPYLETCVSILERIIGIIETEEEFGDLIPTQRFYSKNQKFSLLKDIDSITKNATKSIKIYDPYADQLIIEALSDVDSDIEINLLLLNPSDKLILWADEYKKEKLANLNYKKITNKDIHDRYIIVDETEIWQLGGSINSKNMNGMSLTKIDDPDTQKAILESIEKIEK